MPLWGGRGPSLEEVAERVGVGGLEGDVWRESTRTRTGGSWSVERGPEPECPLIMPCEARKLLIFSRSSVTLLFSLRQGSGRVSPYLDSVKIDRRLLTLIHSGRFAPKPRHCSRRRTQVWQAPSSLGCSSHFCVVGVEGSEVAVVRREGKRRGERRSGLEIEENDDERLEDQPSDESCRCSSPT